MLGLHGQSSHQYDMQDTLNIDDHPPELKSQDNSNTGNDTDDDLDTTHTAQPTFKWIASPTESHHTDDADAKTCTIKNTNQAHLLQCHQNKTDNLDNDNTTLFTAQEEQCQTNCICKRYTGL